MTILTDKLRSLTVTPSINELILKHDYNSDLDEHFRGIEAENARLQPLITELLACVNTVDQMCGRYDDALIRDNDATPLTKGMTIGVRHVFAKALARLEALVKDKI